MRLTQDQKKFIRLNHAEMSVREMAGHLGVEPKDVRWGMAELGLVPRDVLKREREAARSAARKTSWKRVLNGLAWLKQPRVGFWLVCVLALVPRLLQVWTVHDQAPFASGGDLFWAGQAGDWHGLAVQIAGGDWFLGSQPVLLDDPLYAYFLASLYFLGGQSTTLIYAVQALLSALTAGLILLLGRRLFGPLTGLMAGLMAAGYGLFALHVTWIAESSLILLLTVLALWAFMASLAAPRWWKWLSSGLLLGLGMLGRASLGTFFPLAILAAVIWFGFGNVRRWGLAAGLLIIGAAAPVSLATLHNGLLGQDWVVLNASFGTAFYQGNGASADGVSPRQVFHDGQFLGWDAPARREAFGRVARARTLGGSLSPSGISAFWRAEAWRNMRAEPGSWAGRWLNKLASFLNAYEVPDDRSPAFWAGLSPVMRWPWLTWGVIAPLGIVGLILSLRGFRKRSLLVLFFLASLVNALLFSADSHHRLLVVPVMLVYAAAVLRWLWIKAARRQWWPLGVALLSLALGYLVAHRSVPALDARFDELVYAQALAGAGEIEKAEQRLEVASGAGDAFYLAPLVKGRILLSRQGQRGPALRLLNQARQRASAVGDAWTVRRIDRLLGPGSRSRAPAERDGGSGAGAKPEAGSPDRAVGKPQGRPGPQPAAPQPLRLVPSAGRDPGR